MSKQAARWRNAFEGDTFQPMLGGLIFYSNDIPASVAFYFTLFGFVMYQRADDRIVEVRHPDGRAAILFHAAAKS